jgi:HAD superfamily hydrolase (TIGR01509 family)
MAAGIRGSVKDQEARGPGAPHPDRHPANAPATRFDTLPGCLLPRPSTCGRVSSLPWVDFDPPAMAGPRLAFAADAGKDQGVKKYILFDHDGVLVDTEFWYYKAGERALADIGLTLDRDQYLRDMSQGLGTWSQARAVGIDELAISRQRAVRDDYYQEYLRTEAIEIDGVVEALAELSNYVRMAIVTTAKRADFELVHEQRQVTKFMDFVLVREDYKLAKPHPEPYLTGLKRLGATREETLVVEDSSRGLNSAVAAGIDCAIVYNEFTKTHDFSRARYRIDTLSELKEIILM